MAGTITGGAMPASAPEFAQMVASLQAGNAAAAAQTAVSSKYFAAYLPRRMAKEMMNPQLSEVSIPDNDATTFIVANLIGSGTPASIKNLWTQNATYVVSNASTGNTQKHILDLTSAQIASINWQTDLVQVAGQNADDGAGNTIAIPAMHVGGYLTLSDRVGDGSIAEYGLSAGTNLRAIEAVYEITMGLTLPQMVIMDGAKAQLTPRFVPEQNPNFFVGQGQAACMSCHAGGASNITHGYAVFADKFDFDPTNGLTYFATPTTNTMKSLGSNSGNRSKVATCNLATFPTCNPDSYGVDPNQGWDLTTWQTGGLLTQMGWQGPVVGQGLNALGLALGQAQLVYQFLTQRVINEICPLGSISSAQIASIASAASTKDNFGYIVAQVASDPSCL
jgi:hypothetical protein